MAMDSQLRSLIISEATSEILAMQGNSKGNNEANIEHDTEVLAMANTDTSNNSEGVVPPSDKELENKLEQELSKPVEPKNGEVIEILGEKYKYNEQAKAFYKYQGNSILFDTKIPLSDSRVKSALSAGKAGKIFVETYREVAHDSVKRDKEKSLNNICRDEAKRKPVTRDEISRNMSNNVEKMMDSGEVKRFYTSKASWTEGKQAVEKHNAKKKEVDTSSLNTTGSSPDNEFIQAKAMQYAQELSKQNIDAYEELFKKGSVKGGIKLDYAVIYVKPPITKDMDYDTAIKELTRNICVKAKQETHVSEITIKGGTVAFGDRIIKIDLEDITEEDLGSQLYKELKNGNVALFLDWKIIRKYVKLRKLDLEDSDYITSIISNSFWNFGTNMNIDDMFKAFAFLDEIIVGGVRVARRDLLDKTAASGEVKLAVAETARQKAISKGVLKSIYDEVDMHPVEAISKYKDFTVHSLVDYAKNRGDKGFIRYGLGVTGRLFLASTGVASKLVTGIVSGIFKFAWGS